MFTFLHDLDRDLREGLMQQLRTLWTHRSTALEGNSLTLGDTAFVLGEGLTVSGKPLKDHEEVVGHARAIDLLLTWVTQRQTLTIDDLFALHRAVQTQVVIDSLAPVGAWKLEPNGTMLVRDGRMQFNDTYARPQDVPALMAHWLDALNAAAPAAMEAVGEYARLHAHFVRIHPFADGNGRMARLLANVPLLRQGMPPIILDDTQRLAYLQVLGDWQMSMGRIAVDDPIQAPPAAFLALCQSGWDQTAALIAEAHAQQARRRAEESAADQPKTRGPG